MTLILQIAAGIVLAVVILVFWRGILGIALALVLLAIALLVLGLGIAGVAWLINNKKQVDATINAWFYDNSAMVSMLLVTAAIVFLIWLIPQLTKKPEAADPNTSDSSKNSEHH